MHSLAINANGRDHGSSSLWMTTGLYAAVGAVVASAFGLVLMAPVLLVMVLLPPVAAMWYAKRRGVSLSELTENSGARSTMISIVVYGAAMMLTFAAMAYTGYMGHSILPVPSLEVTPGEDSWLEFQGAVIGWMVACCKRSLGVAQLSASESRREGAAA